MNQRILRTLIFVGAAVVCLGGAIATSIATRPVKLDDAALVGQEFFPDFQDPTKATGLRVAAYDKEAAKVNVFNVEVKDGLWRIPSHHNYPADGEEQLAKTAASVVGITRGIYAGKTAEDQKRMGVLDPLDESITGTEGRGARITLFQGGKALVDLIIGNKVEETGDIYYVRKADDARVYRAELTGLKVSTKFADWIEPDLLQIDRNKLVQMIIDRYQVDEQQGSLKQGEISVLTKKAGDATAQWQLEGLDPATEKVKTATINQMTMALDDLKIVGVREKPQGLVDVLKGTEGAGLSEVEVLQMQRAGYFLTPEGQLVSNEGEILAGTDEGVRYTLRFGEVLSGTDTEIEVGSASETTADGETADNPADDAAADAAVNKNRYLFITAAFDESLLGERPAAPVKPVPPSEQPAATPEQPAATPEAGAATPDGGAAATDDAGVDPLDAAAEEAEAEAAAADPAATTQPAATTEPAADAAQPAATDAAAATEAAQPGDPAAAATEGATETEPAQQPAQPDPQQVYQEALQQYELDLAAYEARNAEFDKKIADGSQRATELNERFAPWYYVISADLFNKLKVDRAELVEPPTPPTTGAAGGPSLPFGAPPTTAEPAETVEPAATAEPEAGAEPDAAAEPASTEPTTPAAEPAAEPATDASNP